MRHTLSNALLFLTCIATIPYYAGQGTERVTMQLERFPDILVTMNCDSYLDINPRENRLEIKEIADGKIQVNYGFFRIHRGTYPVVCYKN